ncbi:MAG: hypothetical protein ACJ76D_06090 [Solirubrobacterales bacterium]
MKAKLGDPDVESLTIVAAWMRFGGLRRLKPDIESFRERGGALRLILGIDEGVATRPGLLLALNIADEAFVFHDRSGRTFHPKVYLGEGRKGAWLLVGSSNVTAGGLFSNYEASLEAYFEFPTDRDAAALLGVQEWIRLLLGDRDLCLPLDQNLVDQLCASSRYLVADGEKRRAASSGSHGDPDLFGSSVHSKGPVPGLPVEARTEREEMEGVEMTAENAPSPAGAVLAWSKTLSKSDAQHPTNPSTNPLGNVRLTKGNSPYDWRIWFREELFAEEEWQQRTDRMGNPIEVASVSFLVIVDGEEVGIVDLEVDHAPHRESDQSNHATVLHWGPLTPTFRTSDYSGYELTLEKLFDGSYRLDLAP